MKIIFLDIDGVLNNDYTFLNKKILDDICIDLLYNAIKDIPDLKLVLSSSWRSGGGIERFCEHLKRLRCYKSFSPLLPFFHEDYCTPKLWKKRGHEVKLWLADHKDQVDKYLCIDDDGDFLKDQPLLQTDNRIGLGLLEAEIIKMFFDYTTGEHLELAKERLEYTISRMKRRLSRRRQLLKLIKEKEIEKSTD